MSVRLDKVSWNTGEIFMTYLYRILAGMLCVVAMSAAGVAQVYPRWFLEPAGIQGAAAGYTQNFFLQTSSDSAAFMRACENLARQHYTEFRGGEAYWETEAGVYWMGDNFTETIDSTFLTRALSKAKQVAKYSNKSMTMMLVSANDLAIPDSMFAAIRCPLEQPGWVEDVPQSSGYICAEGVASQYFYESSSWEAAEKRARFNLARSMKVTLETMQKVGDGSGQEIRNEEVSEALHDIEVVYRWRDVKRGLYYVLMRTESK